MATAGDLINIALRTCGALASGETADYSMANDALVKLNHLLESLSNESLIIYEDSYNSLTLDGSIAYTFGTSGSTDISSERPTRIHGAIYRTSDVIDYPVDIVTQGEFNAISAKTTTGDIVQYIHVNNNYPNLTIYVYPVSSTGTLVLNSSKPFTAFAGLTTSVSFPPGYERMLIYGLASELMIEYGILNQAIEQRYIESKADLKRTNTNPATMRVSVPFGRNRGTRHFESDGA